jgi:hypothetical protein
MSAPLVPPTDPTPKPIDPATPPADAPPTPTEPEKDFQKLYQETLTEQRKWERRAKDNTAKAKQWDDAEKANQSATEQATARATEAEAKATKALHAAIAAEIKAAAADWANPADAPRFLDDKDSYVNADGEIDTTAIAKDVAAILTDRPFLAKTPTAAPPAPDGRGGHRPDPAQGHRGGVSLADEIRAAEVKGDVRGALALKTRQLLDGTKR